MRHLITSALVSAMMGLMLSALAQAQPADPKQLTPWLDAEAFIDHTEARTDRFVAGLYRWRSAPLQFTVAYTVRAVSPGIFVHPGAVVEDMYLPERRANTAAGTVEVVGPTR